jgi:hypothetical protein
MDGVLPLNLAIEFHDSEVASTLQHASDLNVAFSAAIVHGSSGIPGSDNGIVVLQAVELVLRGVDALIATNGCVGKLSDGCVEIQGTRHSLLSVPSSQTGVVRLSLAFANGSTLEASGTALEVSRNGEPRFLEVFHC